MKLKEIASRLGARLEPPDTEVDIIGVAPIETAGPGQITFIADPRYAAAARSTRASAVIVDEKFPALAPG
ncbi:MAG TPA: LpxD N-terminal domain-containing protein, partial [Pyrinomonadaceae bacterium]|nr:LpxD N-terminal domain-containing protein [Pyrinomonadaceae bacterium]